jgi:hypothetical protein
VKHFIAFLGVTIGFLLGSIITPASAQTPANCGVNFVPVVGVNCANLRQATYAAVMLKMVPAASATDFLCISGSATKSIHIRRIGLSGTAGTLITTTITLLHRVSLNTGTVATATYIKAATGLRSTNPAATAVVVGYNSTGGNPTIVDTSPTYIRNSDITLNLSGTTAAAADRLIWEFGTSVDAYSQGLDIPSGGTAEQYCLNLNAVSVSSGVLDGSIEWTED